MIRHRVSGNRRRRAGQARGAYLFLLVTLLVAGLAVVPAYAAGAPGHSHHESPGLPGSTLVLLLTLAGMGFLATRRWGRRAAFLTLALLVAWFGLESAVHSVHHFWDPES